MLFMENKDALLALPSSVKTIAAISIVVFLATSILRSAARLIKIAVIVALVYFGAVYLGVI
jgi:hypothetical protein